MGYQLDEETLTKILINNDNNVANATIEIWEQHEQPPQSAVASPWERRVDSQNGQVFYYNTETKELSWNAP